MLVNAVLLLLAPWEHPLKSRVGAFTPQGGGNVYRIESDEYRIRKEGKGKKKEIYFATLEKRM